jgi:hypothetical protein
VKPTNFADNYIVRKVSEVYMLRHNISLESIRQMSEQEASEYVQILGVFDELESEQMKKGQNG